jgi:pimeloyl-ACP methyl ester carboxylesterase
LNHWRRPPDERDCASSPTPDLDTPPRRLDQADRSGKAALTGEFADTLAEAFRRSVSTGIAGWRDDDLAFARSWGFDLSTIHCPVAVWQGGQDRMVPFAHGQWLAAHIPTARVHLHPDEGHLSLGVAALDRIVADLAQLGLTGQSA